jgi:hypothetical protein
MRICLHLLLIILWASVSPLFIGAQPVAPESPREPSPSFEGTVLDANGLPVAGAEVNIVASSVRPKDDPQAGSTTTSVLAKTKTDQQGHFRVVVQRAAVTRDILVIAFRAGQSLAWCFLEGGKDKYDTTLRQSPPAAVSGVVNDASGRPLSGVAVKLCSIRSTAPGVDPWLLFTTPPESLSSWPVPSVTRDDGTFSLEGISPQTELILEIDDERVARQRWRFLVDQDVGKLTINAKPSRNVEGRVVLGDQDVPATATVVLTSWYDSNQYMGAVTATTDVEGRFSVRPFASDRLDIRVVPIGNTTYQPLERHIPWPSGTTTQRMFLTLHEKGWKPIDRTTRDGLPASKIEPDYPTTKVEKCQPTEPLSDKLSGTIVASAYVRKSKGGEQAPFSALIAIEPNSGRWRVLDNGGISISPRVSPDGNCIANARFEPSELNLLTLRPIAKSRRLATGTVGSPGLGTWGNDGQSLFVNVNTPAQRDYYGEEYWGQEGEAWKIDREGVKQEQIPIPPLYDLYDVSHDGQRIAMHWDTHRAATGAQLYIAHTDGTALKPLARKKYQYYWYPRFHPTDKTVCAMHVHSITHDRSIHVIAVDGSQERSITLPERHDPETACWSPDGRFLAIPAIRFSALSGGPKIRALFIVNESGTQFRQVALENVEELWIYNVDWTAADLVSK